MKTLLAFMLLALLLAATPLPASAASAAGRVALSLATHLGIAHSKKERLPDNHKEPRFEYGNPNAEASIMGSMEHQWGCAVPNAEASIMGSTKRKERSLLEMRRFLETRRLEYAE